MSEVMTVGLLSLVGTVVGSIGGILTANKLTNYRIQELERKVDKHNSVIERTAVMERDMKTAFNRIDENHDRIEKLGDRVASMKTPC